MAALKGFHLAPAQNWVVRRQDSPDRLLYVLPDGTRHWAEREKGDWRNPYRDRWQSTFSSSVARMLANAEGEGVFAVPAESRDIGHLLANGLYWIIAIAALIGVFIALSGEVS